MQGKNVTWLVQRPIPVVVLIFFMTNIYLNPVLGEAPPPQSGSFTIVVLPDTQCYCSSNDTSVNAIFAEQTQWIVDHIESHNIQIVLHEGDIVDFPGWDLEQWDIAREAMGILDGHIPYVIATGNHDYNPRHERVSYFNEDQYFGPNSPYGTQGTIGGFYEEGKTDNSYHLFRVGDTDWMVVALQFGPSDEVVQWANNIVAAHPDYNTILIIHAYLGRDDTLLDTSKASWGTGDLIDMESYSGVTVNDGQDLWDKLVKNNPNIRLVLCGHIAKQNGLGLLTSIGDQGQIVHQILSNFQCWYTDTSEKPPVGGWCSTNGGNGFMLLIDISPDGVFNVRTYSPNIDEVLTDPYQEFTLEIEPVETGKGPQDLASLLTSAEDSMSILEETSLPLESIVENYEMAQHLEEIGYLNTAKWIIEVKVLPMLNQFSQMILLLEQARTTIDNATDMDNQTLESLQCCWASAQNCLEALDMNGTRMYLNKIIDTSVWRETSTMLPMAQRIIKELEEAGDRRAFIAKGDYDRALKALSECDHEAAGEYLEKIVIIHEIHNLLVACIFLIPSLFSWVNRHA